MAQRPSARRCSSSGSTTASRSRSRRRDGSHLLDLCVDYVGRDGVEDMRAIASRFATASTLPIVLDSTEPTVIETGLECLGGRSVVNSVNYEDGDGPQSRFARTTRIAVEHGAALIALTIDEQGQARTPEHKVAVAERLIADLTGHWGVRESDILIDCLTFTIATGQEESRRDGVATIEAIRELKRRHPDVQTTLGLSNISFGLNPAARAVLNSAFLHECVKAGLDSAIVHAARILPIVFRRSSTRSSGPDLRPAATGAGRPAGRTTPGPLSRAVRGCRRVHRSAEPGRRTRRSAAVRTAGTANRRR